MKVLIITGPTATGKTHLAVTLARQFNGEIISADCRQVYVGLDLGTGKDLDEYGTPPDRIPTHLIDITEPDGDFNLQRFLDLTTAALDDITRRGRLPIIAGGTPLYIHALLNGYDLPGGAPDLELQKHLESLDTAELLRILRAEASPELLARVDTTQRKRIIRAIDIARHPDRARPASQPLRNPLILAPFYDRQTVRQRIAVRLDQRLQLGLIDEVRRLHDQGVSWERLDWFGLEYRYIARYLQQQLTFAEMREQLLNKIRDFAKSQDIWFRKYERENHPIHWLPEGDPAAAEQLVRLWLADQPLPPPKIVLNNIRYSPKSR